MKNKKVETLSIDEYIAIFPKETQKMMKELRAIIKAAAPKAEEKIAYKMACFAQNGNLVLFAAWKNRIGFYGDFSAMHSLQDELSMYAAGKDQLKFALDKPLPLKLISRIVKLKVAENLKNAKTK